MWSPQHGADTQWGSAAGDLIVGIFNHIFPFSLTHQSTYCQHLIVRWCCPNLVSFSNGSSIDGFSLWHTCMTSKGHTCLHIEHSPELSSLDMIWALDFSASLAVTKQQVLISFNSPKANVAVSIWLYRCWWLLSIWPWPSLGRSGGNWTWLLWGLCIRM